MAVAWVRDGAGWRAEIGVITLYASPEHTTGVLGDKPKRGTTWRAGVSQWDEATRCLSRYGRDCYSDICANANEAMRLAETTFNTEQATS